MKELSEYLLKRFGKGFSVTNLKQMRKFYLTYVDDQIGQTVSDQFKNLRLWKDTSNNLSPKDCIPKMKPPKGKKKGDQTPCDSSSIAFRLLPLLERWNLKPENPFWLIFKLYNQQFLTKSVEHGLTSVTTSTCMWPLIPIVTFLFFRF